MAPRRAQVPALLIIDSFAPHVRDAVLEQAVAHRPGVWVLRQHVGDSEESVLEQLRRREQLRRPRGVCARTTPSNQVHLLIFVDCLVVLDIIRKWGRSDFHPSPKEVVHFTVIYPLLQELRQWLGRVTLIKVKSHTGCLLNERADELAELPKILKFALTPKNTVLSGCGSDQ
jgi:hypothetical protein